jgi:hypothetical protein
LLGAGLPLTIVLGGLVAVALFGSFSLSEAFILGVILAPTDAGLGSAVVTDTRLPQVVRQSLNVESGLDDGICVPLLLTLLATVSDAGGESHSLRVLAGQISADQWHSVAGGGAGAPSSGTTCEYVVSPSSTSVSGPGAARVTGGLRALRSSAWPCPVPTGIT